MDVLNYYEILAALAGFAVSILLCVFPRFGTASWLVALTLVPAVVACGIVGLAPTLQWSHEDAVFLSFASLIICVGSGCLASYSLERAEFRSELRRNRWFFAGICAAVPILISSLYAFRPVVENPSVDLIALGPGGYASAIYLLLISVIILANIEQTLRSAEEYIRWEIKFLLIGVAAIFAAVIYVASQVLLYTPEYAVLPVQALRVFPAMFLCASLLIVQSWRRCTGRGRLIVSQGIVFSTITLLSVGCYLVVTSLSGRWLSEWAGPGFPLEPIIFLVSAIALAAILLGTAFRHRTRRWIRRNLFAGNYDYRQLWMDATEKVRSIDSAGATAGALAQLIHGALGSMDITVWLRGRDPQELCLVFVRGTASEDLNQRTIRIADIPTALTEPCAVSELEAKDWPDNLLELAKASLVVPLISSGRLIGLVTVGSDRSGSAFDPEAREFLRVLSVHAASELHKSELLESLVQTREAEAFRTFSTFLLHDLKNFASTLSLIAKNAVRHHGNPDFQLDAFQSIVDTAEKMRNLCNGLRTFSTSLAANKRLDNLNDIVIELVGQFEVGLSERVRLDLSAAPRIEIDRQEFSRVLQNLILNANEAGPNGPIELSTRAESDSIVVCVRDKGKGISQAFLENELFQPFRTTKGDGLGIGLFQSKKIVEAHNGTIEVESKEGEGTLVRIALPLPRLQTRPIESSTPGIESPDFPGQENLHRAAAK
jgi:putative PEP-CTERM system histidine kinase